jgi:transcription elongation factor S-II
MPVKTIENPETFRANVCAKLNEFFLPAGGNEKHGINLEKGIHNWALKESSNRKVVKKWDNPFFVQIYLDHLRSIYFNLSNETIINQVVSGEIKSHTIAFMTHHEMRPEKWAELIRLKSIRDKSKFETHLEASTDTFTCRKCKSKKCSYYAQQVRSSDEPMTLFVSCLECGARWKS